MKSCVLLPAFNEERAIARLLKDIQAQKLDVVVVDDGSMDNTASVAQDSGAVVLKHPGNLGKGQALRTGFNHIVSADYDCVIIMDADGQHSPQEVASFIQQARSSDAGIIIGNRMHRPEGMPLVRWLTNVLTSNFVSGIVGYKIPDSQCGFRLIRTQVLKTLNLSTIKYDTETEILIEAARNNFRIESIPIKTIYAGNKSQIHPIIDSMRFFNLIRRNLFRKK